jgi:lipopolysaccharide/colanic/teichoic acid biosynthesis glycosyltransferase
MGFDRGLYFPANSPGTRVPPGARAQPQPQRERGFALEQVSQPRTAGARQVHWDRAAYQATKRLTDLCGSAVLVVLLSPVMVSIALATWIDSGLPIIYRSRRLGQHGKPIIVLKFRTMRNGSHHHLAELLTANEERQLEYDVLRKLRDDPRRTRIGAVLRKTSLDELPQLWNVLRGEMTLVGPRPYFADELESRPEAAELLSIRPGITGLWQVNGRSDRTFDDRVRLDKQYLRRRGFVLDMKILVRTVGAVLSGRGAY